ncbi:DUF1292 domain-containing protein [Paenibacillus tarimensis]|uniref:DUF1292 domain-containing protein n=1 Tax=Paenibacillus tarimensis TaxID=416012 RepID=UPI001F16E3B3|nr:DUF1292 domain-containing protein [Paenibacillus tarimensis]MCF2944028.1 DUF1292 domain-containing protein [Paenibacillus tarimensis]
MADQGFSSTVQRLARLKEAFGNELELVSEDGSTEPFRILAEYRIGAEAYAALQTPAMRKEDEIAFFKVAEQPGGELSLESIDDEDEWESAAEAYDELLFEQE